MSVHSWSSMRRSLRVFVRHASNLKSSDVAPKPGSKLVEALKEEENKVDSKNGSQPFRYDVPWKTEQYYDKSDFEVELRRVMNVCHGCRRCFSLCQTFPDAFNAIDKAPSGEVDTVPTSSLTAAADKCTLCDMCFLTKCPYVPPHPLNIDLPQLVLRQRAIANVRTRSDAQPLRDDPSVTPRARTMMWEEPHVESGVSRAVSLRKPSWKERFMTSTDFIGNAAGIVPSLANWSLRRSNTLTRTVMQWAMDIHRNAELPSYVSRAHQFVRSASPPAVTVAQTSRRVVIYATCLVNYSLPNIGHGTPKQYLPSAQCVDAFAAAQKVLEKQRVHVRTLYPACCGMPQLEQGNLGVVSQKAQTVAAELRKFVDDGYDVITLVASCGLMLKHEWPLLLPDNENVTVVGKHTRDICEYLSDIAREQGGLAAGLQPLSQPVVVHHACHARAQNIGPRSLELLKLIPQSKPTFVERCSGHGGSIGVKSDYHETAVKLCKPVAARVNRVADKATGDVLVVSDCPLAAKHIVQVAGGSKPRNYHPVELLAESYGLLPLA